MSDRLKLGAQALAVAGVGLLATLLVWKLTHQTPPPKVGAPAPAFSLERLTGEGDLSLRSFRGKTVVLNFFASWCGPCKREAPVLEHLWQQDKAQGLVVLGVDANDARGDALKFVHAHDLTYPVVFDHDGRVASNRYAIANLPATYVLNPKGRIVGGQILGPVSEHAHSQALLRYVHAALKS
ncbi:MAG TPA: TlpA disulfide reductase family protein [Gaiellaceae bacterium]|nr:TlpA disulfide reductase family protein [Gaiellaceae bacterium]